MKVLVYPHPDLRKKAVAAPHLDMQPMVKALAEKMRSLGGVGLASTQVGLPGRWFVWQTPDMGAPELVLEPQWTAVVDKASGDLVFGKVEVAEGCLSVPGFSEPTRRFSGIRASWKTPEGQVVCRILKDLQAQVFQHECDHLDGKLFVDQLKPGPRGNIMGALKKGPRYR